MFAKYVLFLNIFVENHLLIITLKCCLIAPDAIYGRILMNYELPLNGDC
jgi:hypothetical protein